jgi:multidrug efflux pump subunit AcrA (membrane-fusion protein)
MQTSWKRRILILPPIIIGVAILALVMKNKKAPEQLEAVEQSRTVRAIKTTPTDVVPRIFGYGVVEPGRVWNAVAQVSGRIVKVHKNFKKGAILDKGTEIIRIAPEDYEIAIRQANANIRAAEAKLQELALNTENTKASLAIERESLGINEKEYKRSLGLTKRGTIAQATLDKERRNLLNQRKRVLDFENALKLIPTQIKAQIEQKAISAAQLETAKLNLQRTIIKLPFNARIAKTNVEITQFVVAGTVLGVADSMQRAEISAQIPQARLLALLKAATNGQPRKPAGIRQGGLSLMAKKLGMHAIVRVRLDEKTIEWPATVARISDTVDPKTRTVGAIVSVNNAYKDMVIGERPPLVKGMFTEVEIRISPIKNEIIIPRAALHANKVYLVDDQSRLLIKPVSVKLVQGDFVVIDKGVVANDRVVVSDLSPAIAGMLLQVEDDPSVSARLSAQASGKESLR